ncbi:SDR family NAD(P)-dependent oxidoreductase [Sphingomonadaceae bacterium G21617-S1]|nr:SDR family NAD(P)-dependent oxidoreductase [Sphingomonadaceae bacterium G21617-S1]
MKDFKDRTAVVIAGGNGIGRSIALALADEGVNIVVADIRADAAERVRDEVIARGRRAIAVPTDVTDLRQVNDLADAAYAEFGSVEILINNAGVAVRPFRAIWDTTYSDLEYMIGINIWGFVHGVHVFVPRMREQAGEKHMVNTSSNGALFKVPGNATYTMTKMAVEGLSSVIREELAPYDFGVTTLYPGLVATGAAAESGKLRSMDEQSYDQQVKPYYQYALDRGEVRGEDRGAGRGVIEHIGSGDSAYAIEPEVVGPMVVQAIRENRASCLTHIPPIPGIMARSEALLSGYKWPGGE